MYSVQFQIYGIRECRNVHICIRSTCVSAFLLRFSTIFFVAASPRRSPAKFSKPPCWTSWNEADTASPWQGSPRRGSRGSTNPRQIHSRARRIPRMSTCKSPGLTQIRVKKKKRRKEKCAGRVIRRGYSLELART